MNIKLLALIFLSGIAQAQTYVVPPTQAIQGRTQAQWSAMWWQWAGSFERMDSPIGDTTGALCARKQEGAVWFLAGTYGTHRTIRTCKIPSGKYLFLPLINYVVMPGVGSSSGCMSMMSQATLMTNNISALIFELDGERSYSLNEHRQATNCFDMGVRSKPKVKVFPSAANGYYVMLRPLPKGTHTLNFGGALPSMLQAVSYTLEVE